MKTIESIEKEMATLVADRGTYTPRERSAAKKRMQFLSVCKMYLSDMPSQAFLIKERDRIENRIDLINKDYGYWKTFQPRKNSIDDYNKEMGVENLVIQLKTIKFLLNE